jgi:hypothetical protein
VLIGDEPGTAISASAISYGDSDVETELDGVNGRLQRQQGIIAESFSAQSTYNVGDSVIYEAGLYTFKANKTAGAWDATKVDGPFKVTNELSSLKSEFTVFQDYIPGETQTVTFENGKPHTITHTVDGTVVRTDTITYTPISVVETRAIDGKTVTITTNLRTLETEVEEQ